MPDPKQFNFEISLSVLNHLGRKLYRNFITILGEAISNAWDANANNVWITIDRENNNFIIKDDGDGMNGSDFQNKFLLVGYSKREGGETKSHQKDRPFIGAKGIGKLALLSCAEKISIISKTSNTEEYVGGVIDNSGLDEAIKQQVKSDQYILGNVDGELLRPFTENHDKGTIIYFEKTKENIKNTVPYLKKLIALYFRFSLIDAEFKIHVNNELVTLEDIKDLSDATEFLWKINDISDPYLDALDKLKSEPVTVTDDLHIAGFIATVEKPSQLKVAGTEEKIGIDLFVNGRLRERDVLKHTPDFSTRHVASYLYGQIHYDELDQDGNDRFTSSREGIVPGDEKFQKLITVLKENILGEISNKWDELRLSRDEDGDDENPRKGLKERRARSLYNLASKDYVEPDNDQVARWVKELQPDAEFNVPAYVDCFLSENIVRKHISEKRLSLTPPAVTEINEWKAKEILRKAEANISFEITKNSDDLNYLGMDFLAKVVEGNNNPSPSATLVRDAIEYKPMRNAVGHTALLTDLAKQKLRLVFENVKGRIRTLLSN
jgi:hypothetical protein